MALAGRPTARRTLHSTGCPAGVVATYSGRWRQWWDTTPWAMGLTIAPRPERAATQRLVSPGPSRPCFRQYVVDTPRPRGAGFLFCPPPEPLIRKSSDPPETERSGQQPPRPSDEKPPAISARRFFISQDRHSRAATQPAPQPAQKAWPLTPTPTPTPTVRGH